MGHGQKIEAVQQASDRSKKASSFYPCPTKETGAEAITQIKGFLSVNSNETKNLVKTFTSLFIKKT